MPEIETKKHEVEPEEDEDVIVKAGGFRIYFQNYYTIISLGNDLLTGGLYFLGSLANLFGAPAIVGQLLYIAGGFFLLMRPILKIMHNVFIYDKEEYQEEVKDVAINEEDEEERSDERKSEESDEESEEESERGYNENYYGEEESQEEKKEKIEEFEEE